MRKRQTIDQRLRSADVQRAVPDDVRARLESVLIAGTVPEAARRKVEHAMLAAEPGEMLRDIDAPRPLPPSARVDLERALGVASAPPLRAHRSIAAVAAALAVAAAAILVVRLSPAPEAQRPSLALPGPTVSSPAVAPGDTGGPVPAVAPRPGTVPQGASGGLAPRPTFGSEPGPPPPYTDVIPYTSGIAPAYSLGGGQSEPPPPPPPAPPITVGIIGGNAAQEAGFRAYIDLLNGSGGVRRHQIRVVKGGLDAPVAFAIATVNLSDVATDGSIAASGVPLLETLAVPDHALRGNVFDLASPVDRQAHLAVDAVFPEAAPGSSAVIFESTSGVFAHEVPDALAAVLTQRQVQVVRVTYTPGNSPVPVPATAAFLSLGAVEAADWLNRAGSYSPERGVTGVFSMYDSALLPRLRDGWRVLSPYAPSVIPGETAALRSKTKRSLGAPVIHGWVSAKALAMAIWRSGATSPSQMARALDAMRGFQIGFAPGYIVRSGSHSRVPEAVVLVVERGAFVARDSFVRDER